MIILASTMAGRYRSVLRSMSQPLKTSPRLTGLSSMPSIHISNSFAAPRTALERADVRHDSDRQVKDLIEPIVAVVMFMRR